MTPNEEGTAALRDKLRELGDLEEDAPVEAAIEATHRALARSPSRVLLATLDDAVAVAERPNVPGTVREWPNWSLALPQPLEDIEAMELPRRLRRSWPAADDLRSRYPSRMVSLGVVASLMLAGTNASGAGVSGACGPEQVPWRGECFDRLGWGFDEKTCPGGVIDVPEGEDHPRCTPCKDYAGRQQPKNQCAALSRNRPKRR